MTSPHDNLADRPEERDAACLHDLGAPYALDALDADEAAAFEAHLAGCEACRQEVASFRATAAMLADETAVAPPPGLRDDVLAAIGSVRQDPPVVTGDEARDRTAAGDAGGSTDAPGTADPVGRSPDGTAGPVGTPPAHARATSRTMSWAGRLGLGLAAAFMVVAGALGLWVNGLQGQIREQRAETARLAAVLGAEDSRTLSSDGTTLVVDAQGSAVVASSRLQAPAADEVLQVWVIDADGTARSAGLFEDPTQPRLLDLPVQQGSTVGITVEPAGGSETPTSDPVWAETV
jgi:anti-sigma-K factor RskA